MVNLELIHVCFMFKTWHDHLTYFVMSFLHFLLKSSTTISRSPSLKQATLCNIVMF
jgi:hypothetical protein